MKPPKLICRPLSKRGFSGEFDPRKSCTIHNPLPQKRWPFKFNEPVYFLHPRFNSIMCGRVSWYNPARKVDASCVTTEGCPFYRVVIDWGTREQTVGGLVSVKILKEFSNSETGYDVFKHSPYGFRKALLRVAKYCDQFAATCDNEAKRSATRAAEYRAGAKKHRRLASRVK